jgi:hypothetical protein
MHVETSCSSSDVSRASQPDKRKRSHCVDGTSTTCTAVVIGRPLLATDGVETYRYTIWSFQDGERKVRDRQKVLELNYCKLLYTGIAQNITILGMWILLPNKTEGNIEHRLNWCRDIRVFRTPAAKGQMGRTNCQAGNFMESNEKLKKKSMLNLSNVHANTIENDWPHLKRALLHYSRGE